MTVETPPVDYNALEDGSAKIFGMENFGNTCYCNSILQCLYYSKPFREHILAFPHNSVEAAVASRTRERRTEVKGSKPHPFTVDPNATISTSSGTPEVVINRDALVQSNDKNLGRKKSIFGRQKESNGSDERRGSMTNFSVSSSLTTSEASIAGDPMNVPGNPLDPTIPKTVPHPGLKGIPLGLRFPGQNIPVVGFTDDPFATPEARKREALVKGPIINMDLSFAHEYNMGESLFTSLKDMFESISENESRIGVASPSKLIEVLKRENELFRTSMHQDAHEFFNLLLNEVIEHVDRFLSNNNLGMSNGETRSSSASTVSSSNGHWVHDLFEGLLTSETKCLTCENVSRRDEQFLDLSIDLERNSSVTACLKQFSASEMLCERNKFHCDNCGGLQEAEKRLKVKKLPKILALHLKRFKFTEDMQRNVKLLHRVLYPKHFRLFNTTFDAEDPDKLYELCAVVVHIGGGPYHGHYVSVIKTEHAGWLLFDDEMVEAVDQNYVFNFFGDNKGMATAYVLFYQEIPQSQMEKENLFTNDISASTSDFSEQSGSPLLHPVEPTPKIDEDSELDLSKTNTGISAGGVPPIIRDPLALRKQRTADDAAQINSATTAPISSSVSSSSAKLNHNNIRTKSVSEGSSSKEKERKKRGLSFSFKKG